MANKTFNAAKGKVLYYATLPGAADSLIAVALDAAGLQLDDALIDATYLSDLLGSGNTASALPRVTLQSVAVTTDMALNKAGATTVSWTWTNAVANPVGAVVICYKPTANAADNAILCLTKHDFVVTPNGGTLIATIDPSGYFVQSTDS